MMAATAQSGTAATAKWEVVEPCFGCDLGTQRCRLPVHLVAELKACVGSLLQIDFGSHSVVCALYVWNGQKGNCCQADDTVTVRHPGGASQSELPTSAFRPLHVEILKRIKVDLVMETYSEMESFERDRTRLAPLVKEIVAAYAVVPGCTIDCCLSMPCRLLGLCYVIVRECNLKPFSAGKVTTKTVVEITGLTSRARHEALGQTKGVAALGGLDKPKQLLWDLVTFPFDYPEAICHLGIACPKGILLIGPPGTGKTSLVRAVAHECGACLVYVAGPSICRPQPGDSEAALRDVFQRARDLSREGPCILFVDEVDSFLSKRGESAGSQNDRLVAQMLALMDGLESRGRMVVVGATNRPNVLDPAVRRPGRFDHEVYIGVPTKTERTQILQALTSKLSLHNMNLESVAEWTPGYVGADLALLCQEIAMSKIYTAIDAKTKDLLITEADFRNALMLLRPSTQRGTFTVSDYQPTTWDDIGGLDAVKLQIRQSLEWPILHADVFQRLGVSRPKGVLLYGPPGCCKTTLVRAAATACNASFLSASAAQLYSPYVGDSEKAVAEIFHRGRLAAPTILFLDEIDSIVGKRGTGSHHGIHEKVLSALLNEMDGIGQKFDSKKGSGNEQLLRSKTQTIQEETAVSYPAESDDVFVIAATNRPDLLDDALLRPGRFDRIIYVPPPDAATRKEILKVITGKMPVSHLNFEELAARTGSFTGADLENLCKEAALYALTKDGLDTPCIDQEHFLAVLEIMTPSLTEQQLKFFAELQEKYSRQT